MPEGLPYRALTAATRRRPFIPFGGGGGRKGLQPPNKSLFSIEVRSVHLASMQTVKINCAMCFLNLFLTFLVSLRKKQNLGCQSLGAGHPLEGGTDMGTLWSCTGDLLLPPTAVEKIPKKSPLIRGGSCCGSGTVRRTGVAPGLIERGGQNESTLQVATLCDTRKVILTRAKVSKLNKVLREGWKTTQGGGCDCCSFGDVYTTLWPIYIQDFKFLAQF